MPPRGRMSRQPSPYPRALFHIIRVGQLVSSTIVMSFLAFFVHYLLEDNYYIPWTFIVLLAVSSFTCLSVIVTAYFYHYRVLRPRLSSFINAGLSALWIAGLGMLSWNLSGTLSNSCNVDNWSHDTGIMVCRIYKAVEAFTVAGMLLTIGSLILDFYTVGKASKGGIYNQMDDPKRRASLHPRNPSIVGNEFSADLDNTEALTRHFREPSIASPEESHLPYRTQAQLPAEHFGYAQPQEQTTYEGAGARTLDNDFEKIGA